MTQSLWKTINATLATLTLLGGLTACGGGGGSPDATASTAPTTAQPASLGTVPRFAYVANFASSTVSIYQVDASTGQWRPHGYAVTGDRPSAVTVDPSGQFAYVTNYYCNSISAYAINASNGALTKVGDDVPTGQNPVAITIDARHHFAYVSLGQASAISTYAIDAGSGALTKVGDDVQTGEGPSKLIIDPSGQFAYLNTRGAQTLLAFAIDAQTGALKQIGDATPFSVPDAVAVDPGGKFVYALRDGGVITTFGVDAHTGALTHAGDYAVAGTDTVAFSLVPSGKFGYVVDKTNSVVSAFSVDSATGALTKIGDVATGKQPVAITVDAKGQFAYVANGGDNTVTAYSIDASTGKLSNIGLVRAQLEPSSIAILNGQAAVSVTPQFVYTANAGAKTISAYSVDANSGALTKISDLATAASPSIVAADPYNRFVYVSHTNDNVITAYSIDGTGALHKLGDVSADDAALPAPSALVVDPSGRFVYAASMNSNNIQVYAIDAGTGNLISAGLFGTTNVARLAIDPLGLFIYATSLSSSTISVWRIDSINGGLTAIDSSAAAANAIGIPAIDPSGRYMYVASGGTSVVIRTYTIDASSGQLVYLADAVDTTAQRVQSFVINPSHQFAYAVVYGSGASCCGLSTYTVSSTGLLTKGGSVPFGSANAAPTAFSVDPSGQYAYGVFQLGLGGLDAGSAYSIDAITGALTKVSDLPVWAGVTYSVVVTGMTH